MPSGDLIPAARAQWFVKIRVGSKTLTYDAVSEAAGKQMIEEVTSYGCWDERRYYPFHKVDWMEIVPGDR